MTMRGSDGSRLHPNITDFHAWRGLFAEVAQEHGLSFTATRRHDRAAAPAYKLEHARAVARGDALEATQRRVAAKKADAVVAPRTEQGRAAARKAREEWSHLVGEHHKSEPHIAGRSLDRLGGRRRSAEPLADAVLKQMATRLVGEVAMARMSEAEAKRSVDTIREQPRACPRVSSTRAQGSRSTKRQPTWCVSSELDGVRFSATSRPSPSDATTSGSAGGGATVPTRADGGPSAREASERSSENMPGMRGGGSFRPSRPRAGVCGTCSGDWSKASSRAATRSARRSPRRRPRRKAVKKSCVSVSSVSALTATTSSAERADVEVVWWPVPVWGQRRTRPCRDLSPFFLLGVLLEMALNWTADLWGRLIALVLHIWSFFARADLELADLTTLGLNGC